MLILDLGDDDDRRVPRRHVLLQLRKERPGVVADEEHVENDDLWTQCQAMPRLTEVARRHRAERRSLQELLVDHLRLEVVFDEEDRDARIVGRFGERRQRPRRRSVDAGERGAEGRACADLALERHLPAEQLDQFLRQRQSEARAAHAMLQPVLELAELAENLALILRRDPDSGVGDGELHRVDQPVVSRSDANLPLLGELQCVGDEVAQHLRHLPLVGVHRREVGLVVELQHERAVDQQRAEHAA